MSIFKLYKKNEKVPKFQKMDCYFNAPFLGIFADKFYYILIIKDCEYGVMMFDPEYSSCMNGGAVVDNDISPYQADEYSFETINDVKNFLIKFGFTFDVDLKDLESDYIKLENYIKKKPKKTQYYIVNENVYHFEQHVNPSWISQTVLDKVKPYIKKGTIVTLEDECYTSKNGETVPIHELSVTKIYKK